MKTVEQVINEKIKEATGNILAICPTPSMISCLEENDAITTCDVLSNPTQEGEKTKSRRQKPFQFKKMRKKFKKKRKDMIIGDIVELNRYMKTFIKDSIYVTKGTIYLFIENLDYDYDLLKRRYARFNLKCIVLKCQNGIVFQIEVGQTKNHFWKEKIYYIVDILLDIIEFISEVLVS